MRLRSLVLMCAAAVSVAGAPGEAIAHQTGSSAPKQEPTAARISQTPKPILVLNQAPATVNESLGERAVAAAKTRLGKPYRYGSAGPNSFDCSGLTSWAWAQVGVRIPRTSRAQFSSLPRVSLDALQPGDLVYSPGHIGMYIGNGQMIHSPQTGRNVEIAPLRKGIHGAVRPA